MGGKRSLGALRGLNLANIVYEAAEATIEDAEQQNALDLSQCTQSRHATRASRGKATHVNYSTKYHPMDMVTRPNSKEVLRQSTKSVSFTTPDDDDEQSLPSSPALLDSDEEGSESDTGGQPSASRHVFEPRTPDPRAVRHSSRKEARKAVLYSTKHHPQDFSLPGYRKRAIVLSNSSGAASQKSSPDDSIAAPSRKPRKHRVVIDSSDEQYDSPDDIPARAPQPPRKKLKSIGQTSSRPQRPEKRGGPVKQTTTKSRVQVVSDSSGDIDGHVNSAIAALPPRPPVEELSSQGFTSDDTKKSRLAEFRKHLDLDAEDNPSGQYSELVAPESIPEFVKNRMQLDDYDVDSITSAMLLSYLLADHSRQSNARLHIYKPYEEEALTPVSNEFDEQFAITESSQLAAPSDPLHPLLSQRPRTDGGAFAAVTWRMGA